MGDSVVVVLDPDVAEVFKTPEAVNRVLRALITTIFQKIICVFPRIRDSKLPQHSSGGLSIFIDEKRGGCEPPR